MSPSILPLSLNKVHFISNQGMPLIKDMNLTLSAGPRTVIIGPNGAGKSLLLRLCHGLLKPSGGDIKWTENRAQMKQAMVFQRPVMLRRSVAANIDYALALHKTPKPQRAEIIGDVLAKTGLSRHADAPAGCCRSANNNAWPSRGRGR